MKKIISLVLVCVILMGVAVFSSFAEEPPGSKNFENNDELLAYLSDYAENFPDVDYSEDNISKPSEDYWLENKDVILPVLPEDYATLEECSVLETRYGGGIDCIFSSYTTIESNTNIRFLTYYQMTDDEVDDNIEGLTDGMHPNGVHCGVKDDFQYSAKESTDENGRTTSTYNIAYDDKLVVIYIDEALNVDFVPKIFEKKYSFISTDVILPVYVSGEVNLFEDRFLEIYSDDYESSQPIEPGSVKSSHYYEEIYYHYDGNGEIDWALIDECSYNKTKPVMYSAMYKDRILSNGGYYPFSFRYGVYDVKEDKFYSIFGSGFDFEKYEGLDEALTAYEPGIPLGDVDSDGVLSVMDATLIQRALVGLYEFKWNDDMSSFSIVWYGGDGPKYMSDYDRDGERTILDATAIQRKLAKIN